MVCILKTLITYLLWSQLDNAQRASGYITRPEAVANGSFIQLPPTLPSIIEPAK